MLLQFTLLHSTHAKDRMMKIPAVLTLFTLVFVLAFCVSKNEVSAGKKRKQKDQPTIKKVYNVGDLPVWSPEKEFQPRLLMQLIRASVSPSDWETDHGNSTMACYGQNTSLVILTRSANHKKIAKLLESMRSSE